jgi:hypothetical protein
MADKTINVLICIPSFDTKIHLETISSIIRAKDKLARAGIFVGLMWVRDSLITRARNKLVKSFLDQKDYTHLFFIDADVVFEEDQFIRVLLFDKPITSAPYPIKNDAPIEKGDASLGWCMNFPLGPYDLTDNEKGFKKVTYAGTGFMCIQRNVFDVIIDQYPQIKYRTDVRAKLDNKLEPEEIRGSFEYAFFDTGIQGEGILEDEENTNRYLSEDFYFCQLWRQCGGVIYTDLTSTLKHIGVKTYTRPQIMKLVPKKED